MDDERSARRVLSPFFVRLPGSDYFDMHSSVTVSCLSRAARRRTRVNVHPGISMARLSISAGRRYHCPLCWHGDVLGDAE